MSTSKKTVGSAGLTGVGADTPESETELQVRAASPKGFGTSGNSDEIDKVQAEQAKPTDPATAVGIMFDPAQLVPSSNCAELMLTIQKPWARGKESGLKTLNLRLNRGLNIVGPETLGVLVTKHSKYIESGALAEFPLDGHLDDMGRISNLLNFSQANAVQLASLEINIEEVKKWRDVESRPRVVAALNARVNTLTKKNSQTL